MASMDVATALVVLQQQPPLSILSLSEPLLAPSPSATRTSNISTTSDTPSPTPASLSADLAHYRALFSKLRFSYVEQVTKERFLRALVADPPYPIPSPAENLDLETSLHAQKAALNAQKAAVHSLLAHLDHTSRALATRYQTLAARTTTLAALPAEIQGLDARVADLRARQEPATADPRLELGLGATLEVLGGLEAELGALGGELEALRAAVPRKRREVAVLEGDVVALEPRKRAAIEEAREALRRKRGVEAHELEERGRWLGGVATGLKGMLEV